MEHEQIVELVSASIDGEATDDELRVVDAHLASCPGCRSFAAEASGLRRRLLVQPAGPVTTGPDARGLLADVRRDGDPSPRRLVRRVGAAAAVIGVAATIATVAAIGRTGGPTSGSGSGGDAQAAVITEVIHTGDRSFDHEHVEIPVGATVEWSNVGSTEHVLVQDTGGVTVRTPLGPGANQDVTFDEAGTYDVRCEIHPEMTATVTVDL